MTDEEIIKKSKEILHKNIVKGYSTKAKTKFHYMKPGKNRYPFQYFWDTCLHAYAMISLGNTEMAKECMRSLFALQKPDGFVGHMLFWNVFFPTRATDIFQSKPSVKNFFRPHMSSLLQPPLAAQAVLRIFNDDYDIDFLREMIDPLKNYYKWLMTNRDFDGGGLLSTISYFEAGMDWKPAYDPVVNHHGKANFMLFIKVILIDIKNYLLNYNLKKISEKGLFAVKDVAFNTIYCQNLEAMCAICKACDDDDWKLFQDKADDVANQILSVMYDPADKAFYDIDGKTGEKLKTPTPTIFFPIVLAQVPLEIKKDVVNNHFFKENEFKTPFPLPSVAVNDAAFNPHESVYIWRGPTWVIYNWFLHKCLIDSGYPMEASSLVQTVKELIKKSGFREYYNPFTGEGYGAIDFTWSTLVVDMMKMEENIEKK